MYLLRREYVPGRISLCHHDQETSSATVELRFKHKSSIGNVMEVKVCKCNITFVTLILNTFR